MYRDFNVGSNGVILNNSGDDLTHDKFGNIAVNNNLTNGSASVILNEVTSNKSSSLNGFIEVTGQKPMLLSLTRTVSPAQAAASLIPIQQY